MSNVAKKCRMSDNVVMENMRQRRKRDRERGSRVSPRVFNKVPVHTWANVKVSGPKMDTSSSASTSPRIKQAINMQKISESNTRP
jgi:hypothetical protein